MCPTTGPDDCLTILWQEEKRDKTRQQEKNYSVMRLPAAAHSLKIIFAICTQKVNLTQNCTANVLSAEIADECLQTKSKDNLQYF